MGRKIEEHFGCPQDVVTKELKIVNNIIPGVPTSVNTYLSHFAFEIKWSKQKPCWYCVSLAILIFKEKLI